MKYDVKTIEELIEVSDYKEILKYIDQLILNIEPDIERYLVLSDTMSMIGYIKKSDGFPLLALASQKNFVSLYVAAYKDKENIINKYRDNFNKSVMKNSCLSFNKMKQINEEILIKIIIEAIDIYNNKNKDI